MNKNNNYLVEKIKEFVQDKDEFTKSLIVKTFELVQERDLSVEALAKKVDREIDRMLRSSQKGEDER
ncbi:hypothetical protein [Parageobacillus thermoglucosidasius]|uniref:hypothetical protein n=1 Tax=Parageobacillus thermoglucosidasius TaxID=1426 RepID=UPI0002EEF8CA|nr:hypothetical protein [Parageobacillus thermoglucosidasius]KYD17638.1 hypothetical protein B4168_3951 [Anoxybacillus flavithermus]MED4903608.1 hypothetical protein [Parageobacillus thermoglucosidasius]MED4913183.1 hypothetical protein [Parageobacillus thermoglucosidasius]MED4944749.1 hypothetical protein [Parageobacillus thermoglucosidasius]MED4984658.1 hypothetical protein [Parageobacillus thermoglucosidasius]